MTFTQDENEIIKILQSDKDCHPFGWWPNVAIRMGLPVLITAILMWIAWPGITAPVTMYAESDGFVIYYSQPNEQIASGCCVDRALAILSILERNNLLTNDVKVAVGMAQDSWHCQVVKVLETENQYYFLSGITIYIGSPEFSTPAHIFYDHRIFRAAAMQYSDLDYVQMRDFAARYERARK